MGSRLAARDSGSQARTLVTLPWYSAPTHEDLWCFQYAKDPWNFDRSQMKDPFRFLLTGIFGITFDQTTDICRVWLMCEPASRSREPRVASLFLRVTAFFSYLFIFWRFQFNVNVFLSKWFTLQKKHKFSIFLRAWNSANVVAVVCWGLVYIQIWMKFWASLANDDYVKLTNIQIYTGKHLS